MAKSNRGKKPSDTTKLLLCANTAGRCEFEGCNKFLFKDGITMHTFNNTNVAHIIASSPNGPRGDEELSYELSDKIDNLMLLCPDHHKLIDDKPDEFGVERLRQMKAAHEEKVKKLCEQIDLPESIILRFVSPIKGAQTVSVQLSQAIDAIQGEAVPSDDKGIYIGVSTVQNYNSTGFWNELTQQTKAHFESQVKSRLLINPNSAFSVFPLAPIPLISYLGYLMGDKINAKVYQKTRCPDTWEWRSEEATNRFFSTYKRNETGSGVALIISISADVEERLVLSAYNAEHIFTIKAENVGVDAIQSEDDLSQFWHVYQDVCNRVNAECSDCKTIGVFPAIPVSAAFEVGRRYMPGVYPKLEIYDNNQGFFKALEIGGE